jgi:prepilin-type N-terminal cleavage/methylation domain-containing protein
MFNLGNEMKSITIKKREQMNRRRYKTSTATALRQHHRSVCGFTLIELLLVLVILTTLTAIVLPKFTGRV